MNRRDFVNFVGLGFIATSVPIAIAACSPETSEDTAEAPAPDAATTATDSPATTDNSANAEGFAELGTVAELDSAGFLAAKDFAAGPVIAIRDPANAENVIALSSVCTHKGCNVDWKETEFVCPCHASKFTPEGTVIEGPANKPLAPYEAKIEGDNVLVKAA
ncbi:MAG: ubiquinol-cytochrome c reductase iron-sulfur subunit [Phormidesmis sp.]